MYSVRKNYSERTGHFQFQRIIDFILNEIYLVKKEDKSNLTAIRLLFTLSGPCYEDLAINYRDKEERSKKAADWSKKVRSIFLNVYTRIGEIYFKGEDWIYPYDITKISIDVTQGTNYNNNASSDNQSQVPSNIIASDQLDKLDVISNDICLLPPFFRGSDRRVEYNRISIDLIDSDIEYKIHFILDLIFSHDATTLARGFFVDIFIINDKDIIKLNSKYFPKVLNSRSLLDQSEFNHAIDDYQKLLHRASFSFAQHLKNRYPMFSMKMRGLEYFMRNFNSQPLLFQNKKDFDQFITNLRKDEKIIEVFRSADDIDGVIGDLFVEFDPSRMLVHKLSFDKVWQIECILAECFINYFHHLGLRFDIAYSGNKSIHLSVPILIDLNFSSEFFDEFFLLIDPKNSNKSVIKDTFAKPNMLSVLICLGLSVKMRLWLTPFLQEIYPRIIHDQFFKIFIQDKSGREASIRIDSSPNRGKGQYRTLLSLHKRTLRLKIPLDYTKSNNHYIIANKFLEFPLVKKISKIRVWDENFIHFNYDALMPHGKRSEKTTRKLLLSVLPEILVVLKFGAKQVDEMRIKELDEKMIGSAMLLAKLGFRCDSPGLDNDWVDMVYERFYRI